MSSHSRMSKGGKKASACWGVSSISVRYSFWASGRASLYTLSPPMMNISSSSLQCDRASCKLLNVSAPGKTAALFLLSTILVSQKHLFCDKCTNRSGKNVQFIHCIYLSFVLQ